MVSLGGNVYVCGSKPDGTPWNVGIQDPAGSGYAAMVSLTDRFAVSASISSCEGTRGASEVMPHSATSGATVMSKEPPVSGWPTASPWAAIWNLPMMRPWPGPWRAGGSFDLLLSVISPGNVVALNR